MDGLYIRQPDEDILVRLIEGKSYVYDAETEGWLPDGDYMFIWRDRGWRRLPPDQADEKAQRLLCVQKMKFHEAVAFAAVAHQGQKRKGSGVPYIVHPFEVAQILTEAGCSPYVVTAGLLHDVLEDTSVSEEEIARRFGPKVLKLVREESEDKALSWEERKQRAAAYFRLEASLEAMQIACADKLSNLRSMKADYETVGDLLWGRFKRGKSSQRWYYGEMVGALEPLEDYAMYCELKERFEQVFGE